MHEDKIEEPTWPKDDRRIDNIGQNGNDGLHYTDVKSQMLNEHVTDTDIIEMLGEPDVKAFREAMKKAIIVQRNGFKQEPKE